MERVVAVGIVVALGVLLVLEVLGVLVGILVGVWGRG